MKLKDLKNGMTVETKNRIQYRVIKDLDTEYYGHQDVIFARDGAFTIGSDYNEEMKRVNYDSNDLDIIKVYDISKLSYILNMNIVGELIWERKEEKELTVEEISELLGYTIKVVSKENKHE